MDAVQRMRKKAKDKGTLQSNEQQKVETKVIENKTVIVVEPSNPDVIYVPSYSPTVVYGPPVYPYPLCESDKVRRGVETRPAPGLHQDRGEKRRCGPFPFVPATWIAGNVGLPMSLFAPLLMTTTWTPTFFISSSALGSSLMTPIEPVIVVGSA
jgi:hypothetical protein